MGKVLRQFMNGYPGAVSRSIDNVVVSLRNASDGEIPFGAPVFLSYGERACKGFSAEESTAETFLGFAVRAADKTPDTYGSNTAAFAPGDPVDVLVRGSVVLPFAGGAVPGAGVYIRKSDGALVTAAGAEGSTLRLPGAAVRSVRDSAQCAEVSLTKRNAM